nr:hypothetical protein [Candidatus Freyarchaeota archaeon]
MKAFLLTKPLYPLKLGGVVIFEGFEKIMRSIERCLRAREDPYLRCMYTKIGRVLSEERETYERVKRRFQHVADIARILAEGEEKKRKGRWVAAKLRKKIELMGDDPEFDQHVKKTTESYWEGLFYTYDHKDIPRTNNGLEQFINRLKTRVRKTTGKKSTHSEVVRYGECLAMVVNITLAEAQALLPTVSYEAYKKKREEFEKLQERHRKSKRIRKNPDEALGELEQQWKKVQL